MGQKITMPTEQELGMKKVFASYHFCRLDQPLIQGFGNFVGQFNMEVYAGRVEDFIIHLEKHIKDLLEDQLKFKMQVKVLFFR